uniref:Protein SCAR2 isoform X2 n=1 Tax=Rhizophora mucronata TaxID=61149 RepID=A0A2P2JGN1_RHIMU
MVNPSKFSPIFSRESSSGFKFSEDGTATSSSLISLLAVIVAPLEGKSCSASKRSTLTSEPSESKASGSILPELLGSNMAPESSSCPGKAEQVNCCSADGTIKSGEQSSSSAKFPTGVSSESSV